MFFFFDLSIVNVDESHVLFSYIAEEDGRRPGQRPATSMLGNEVMSKEQLYDLYQQILGVKKFEHQLLYNAMQVCAAHDFLPSQYFF